jgi:hypothetical protein
MRSTIFGMIERHTKGDASAAVVTGHRESFEATLTHDLDVVLRHCAKGVGRVVSPTFGLCAVSVTSQVGGDDREALRQ